MPSFNKVILLGNLTRDPESRTTPAGTTICKFGLAVSRKFNTRDGDTKEETCFVDIDAFGKQAEAIQRYCTKGKPLMVEGRLKLDQWETAEGQPRQKLTVACERFTFIPDGSDRSGQSD